MRRISNQRWLTIATAVILALPIGCRRHEPAPHSVAASTQPAAAPLLYARYLAGIKICLDPGHGGRGDVPGFKRGPTGLQEAEVNLRVAQVLRDALTEAGALVVMTREADVYLHPDEKEDLRLRAGLAAREGCDFLLSIHHNASPRPDANFPSVWYHQDVDYSPASLDIARELASALRDELHLPEQLGCDVLSDELMYKAGFAILREAKVPAVLAECSFFSNPQQENRLRDPEYLRREAHALFVGLARYAYGGVPRARLVEPADGHVAPGRRRDVIIQLDDGIAERKSWGWERRTIPRDSIVVRLNKEPMAYSFDDASKRVTIHLPDRIAAGPMTLWVQFQNVYRHANITPNLSLTLEGAAARLP